MVKGMIVDYGGVLVDSASRHVARVADDIGISAVELKRAVYGENRALWNQTKLGLISEAEHWRQVQDALNIPESTLEYIRVNLFDALPVHEDFVTYVSQLRPPMRLALVSNALPSFSATWERLGFLSLFDVVINSSLVGIGKPSPEVYRLALQGLEISAEECLIVDDKFKNVEAASMLGFKAVRYVDSAQAIRDIARYL